MNFTMPPPDAGFDKRGGWLIRNLMEELGLTQIQAAAIVGTLGAESGLEAIQEHHPISGRGGFGWAQWTGPRRDAFEAFARTLDEANYRFLIKELRGSQGHALDQLKKTTSLEAATFTFIAQFERPSAPQTELARALPLAQRALANKKG